MTKTLKRLNMNSPEGAMSARIGRCPINTMMATANPTEKTGTKTISKSC